VLVGEVPDRSGLVEAPATAQVGQTIVVKEVDEYGKPVSWECADLAGGDDWDTHYKVNMTEAQPLGFSITEVDGKPLKLKEMWAMVKFQNAGESSVWMGCQVMTGENGQLLSTTSSGHGGVNVPAAGYAYFVYHAYIIGDGRAVCDIMCAVGKTSADLIRKTNESWINNWLDYNKIEYITGLSCNNALGSGTAQGYGTEIEIWGKTI
jgi:hypothetical protein